MININTYGPRPDISGHHPGLRAKFLVSQAIWSPPRALPEQEVATQENMSTEIIATAEPNPSLGKFFQFHIQQKMSHRRKYYERRLQHN